MGVYIGDVWVPYVSNFDVDRGNRRVEIVRHIDSTVPPHFAEFPNPILNADISGTLIQNSSSPKTATDYAEDVLSLLDSEKAHNYIHEFQGRSGWLSVGDAESPNDADTPLSREYGITGYFLPSKTYQPRYVSNPSIMTNDFSIVFGSDGADNYIPLPKGASYIGTLDTITRETNDGSITLVKDNSALGTSFEFTEDESDAGECKVWDSVTPGNSTESTWKRIYNVDHVFTGDIYLENGLIRQKIDASTDRELYSYDSVGQVWNQLANEEAFFQSAAGYNYVVDNTWFTELTSDKIELEMSVHAVSYPDTKANARIHISRGQHSLYRALDGGANTRHDINMTIDYAYLASSGDGLIGDKILSINPPSLNAQYAFSFTLTGDFIYMISRPDLATIKVNSTGAEMYASGAEEAFESIIPFDVSALIKECEDMTQGSGVTYYTGADASPKTGNTGSILDAQNEYIQYDFTIGTDLPLGTYKLFVRAKDSNQITDDLEFYLYDHIETEYVYQNVRKTVTGSWAYYVFDVTLDAARDGNLAKINLSKYTADANTIDLDYVLWVPVTSPNGNFPQDIAHQALVEQNLKRELIGRE